MTLSPFFLRFLAGFAVIAGLVGARRILDSFQPSELYRKDFIQEYVVAQALREGRYPYTPLPELIRQYFPDHSNVPWTHPMPHPPAAAFLSIPIGFFRYPHAAMIWLFVEVGCLVLVIELLTRWWIEPISPLQKVGLFLACLGLGPVVQELWYGQFSLVLLLFLTLAWLCLRNGRDAAGGAFLGTAIALKLTAWPIAVFLFLQGRWRAVLSAGAILGLLHGAAGLVMGLNPVFDYYRTVGPRIAREYRQHEENFSLWTVGNRFFSPEVGEARNVFVADPLIASETMARIVTPALPVLALLTVLILACRAKQWDTAFGILLCGSLPINPVVWDHYLLLTAVPIVILARRLKDHGFPTRETFLAAACLLITIFPYRSYLKMAVQLFSRGFSSELQAEVVPFLPGLLTYVLLLPLVGWIILLWQTDKIPA